VSAIVSAFAPPITTTTNNYYIVAHRLHLLVEPYMYVSLSACATLWNTSSVHSIHLLENTLTCDHHWQLLRQDLTRLLIPHHYLSLLDLTSTSFQSSYTPGVQSLHFSNRLRHNFGQRAIRKPACARPNATRLDISPIRAITEPIAPGKLKHRPITLCSCGSPEAATFA
jgi:hypothetical protein